ncbi:hypothetical protein KC19_11G100300 [Ceratodon purpureus]|uniref:Uncharacterized protein n=1 Tax=Ceratodon purpureus TaxID=3225 RepID=A0A8T0GEW2_CERPU|nr:hypothetical protein KC19_11G100300 [Ceratodon purpureus]
MKLQTEEEYSTPTPRQEPLTQILAQSQGSAPHSKTRTNTEQISFLTQQTTRNPSSSSTSPQIYPYCHLQHKLICYGYTIATTCSSETSLSTLSPDIDGQEYN